MRPEALMDGGDHFDDCSHKLISVGQNAVSLTRTEMLYQLELFGHDCRPGANVALT